MNNIDEAAAQALPDSGFVFSRPEAALVVIDPQNDFLSRSAGCDTWEICAGASGLGRRWAGGEFSGATREDRRSWCRRW